MQKSHSVCVEALLLGLLLHRDESQVCGLTSKSSLGLAGQRRVPWLLAGMNPSSLAPTAPTRQLCEPELLSAEVGDVFPTREDPVEVYMGILPPEQKLGTGFGGSGQIGFAAFSQV